MHNHTIKHYSKTTKKSFTPLSLLYNTATSKYENLHSLPQTISKYKEMYEKTGWHTG
jgi:hypothetical protein